MQEREKEINEIRAQMSRLCRKYRDGKLSDAGDFLKRLEKLTKAYYRILNRELYENR